MITNDLKGPNDASYIESDLGWTIVWVTRKHSLKGVKGIRTQNS